LKDAGFTHFEEIQLLADNISKDRVCDSLTQPFGWKFHLERNTLNPIP
jgi:hypothetical protein